LNDPQSSNANCGDKTVICSPRWYASDQYRLLIMVGCVGGDFSQTVPLRLLTADNGGQMAE